MNAASNAASILQTPLAAVGQTTNPTPTGNLKPAPTYNPEPGPNPTTTLGIIFLDTTDITGEHQDSINPASAANGRRHAWDLNATSTKCFEHFFK